jgi:hypothetical protein
MGSTLDILKRLVAAKVEFVLVGGMAGVAHGSSQVTEDLDVCAPLERQNVQRIVVALEGLNPRLRTLGRVMPMPSDPALLSTYKNLYLLTDLGPVDILAEITGVGGFPDVLRQSARMTVGPDTCHVLELATLILAKRALGRPKDLQVAVELEAIRDRLRGASGKP